MRAYYIFFLILLTAPAAADQPVVPPVVAATAVLPTILHLQDMQPVSVSVYPTNTATVLRQYLQFRNSDGNHFLVYEEDSAQPAVKEVGLLRQAMENWNSSCSVDLECKTKPFCTGKCNNMYYQMSNLPATAPSDNKERCRVVSFTCTRRGEAVVSPVADNVAAPAAAAAVAPVTATVPVSTVPASEAAAKK